MNLLQRNINEVTDLMKFRSYQYELIYDIIKTCFEYAKNFGLIYDNYSFEILQDKSYYSSTHFSVDKLRIKLDNSTNNFLELDIPKLIDGVFFKLRGVYYIPLIYILDEPITFKKNSIKLNSLFKPITLYTNDNRIIIDGNNIPFSRFLRVYTSDENVIKEICDMFKTQYIFESVDESVYKLCEKFDIINNDIENLRSFIDVMFFDEWTKGLYKTFYKKDNFTMTDIFEIIINRITSNTIIEFNDLSYKRLVFIELLLDPLFKAINKLIINLKKRASSQLPIKADAIVQHFYASGNMGVGLQKRARGLSGNNYYSISNGFTGLLSLKSSFENPKSQSELPKSVSSIHYNHKGKICPVTISNIKPGVIASLVPNQKIDLKYGLFL